MKPDSSFSPFIRACLVIAIIAGTASTVNVMKLRGKFLTLQTSVKTATEARENAERQLIRTQHVLEQSVAALEEARAALNKCSGERDRAVTEAATRTAQVGQLNSTLKDTRSERDQTTAELARYTNTRMTAQQVAELATTLKILRESVAAAKAENVVLTDAVHRLTAEIDNDSPVKLPANLTTKVNLSDPKWGFVILGAGSEQGMIQRAELLVSRNGKLVAKVRVRRVEKDRSIADLVPEWNFGQLLEGDVALPANPET